MSKSTMKYSDYQLNIFEVIKKCNTNIIVKAAAGSGKTSTALAGMQFMTGDILSLAFNRKIANELGNRITNMALPNAEAETFHAVGNRALRRGRKVGSVKSSKVWNIVDGFCVEKEYWDAKNFITKLVGMAKCYGIGIKEICPISDTEAWMNIIRIQDLPMEFECAVEDCVDIAKKVLEQSNRTLTEIDFDDMIYLPLLFNLPFPQYNWVIVDEAQDTNVVRKIMLDRVIAPGGKFLIIGDSDQAIYGFTGAENNSMELLRERFNCEELPLSICYRCGKNIITEAQKYSKNIEAFENAPDGIVRSEKYDDFLANAASYGLNREDGIICRNNAPLVSLAFGLIRKGIGCRIEGRDIGQNLIALCNKWKKARNLNDFMEKLVKHFTKEFDKATNKGKMQLLEDKLETLIILIERCQSLGKNDIQSLIDLIDSMFSDADHYKGPNVVVLSSIHKSKGLEFERCYSLGLTQFCPSKYAVTPEQQQQETNLAYVCVTRGKSELVYITDVPSGRNKSTED